MECACKNCNIVEGCPHIEVCGKIIDLKAQNDKLKNDINGAKVSLDKFFEDDYKHDLTNQTCDVREMYCKLGDENDKLREILSIVKKVHIGLTIESKYDEGWSDCAKHCAGIIDELLETQALKEAK